MCSSSGTQFGTTKFSLPDLEYIERSYWEVWREFDDSTNYVARVADRNLGLYILR